MRILFSTRILSQATRAVVLLPFVALAFACEPNYATPYGFRKTQQVPTRRKMNIRNITRKDISDLLHVLRVAGAHGHREWQTDDETGLLTAVSNGRLDPDLGRWAIAYQSGSPIGYALVEPELNIGRVLIGLATMPGNDDALAHLLENGIERAKTLANGNDFEIHVAVRDTEPQAVRDALLHSNFHIFRTAFKMRVNSVDVALRYTALPTGLTMRDADLSNSNEVAQVTKLHNDSFIGSWGFSPNTVEEISGRAAADADRIGFAPIIVVERDADGELIAYIWITISDGDGRVEMVGVTPEMRGTGLGWATFNVGATALLENGANTLSLDVDSLNPPARRIYEAAGYRTYSEVDYYGLSIASG